MLRDSAADSFFGLVWYLWTSDDDMLEKLGWFLVFLCVQASLLVLELYDYVASGLVVVLSHVRKRADAAKRE